MKKVVSFLSVLFLLVIESLLTFSCEVGLGAAVDTSAPSVVISNPKDSAIIRGEFALMGTWSDDGFLDKINVVLNSTSNPSLKYEFRGEFTGNAQGEAKKWRCVINPLSETKPIKDGTYKATVSVLDTVGHKTIVTKTFTIDNTAPVIVLQRPGTAIDAANADSYGQTFTLEGQGADSSNIAHIDIHIYSDRDCLNFLRTVTLNNVPLNIKLDAASFKDEAYTAIYGSKEKKGEKRLFCKIDAYDSAQKYPTEFGKNQSAEDTQGNKTSSYYLYDKLAADILSKYNIARLYEMMNGTYTLSGSEGDGQTPEHIMDSVKTVLRSRAVTAGTFTLNPENNPKFTLNGKDALKSESLDISNEAQGYFITNGSDVTVEVSPGLDGTPVVNTTEKPLKVYALECDAQGTILSGAKKIYLAFANVNPSISRSGSTYKIYINVDAETAFSEEHSATLKIGKMYKLGVEGEDLNGNKIISSASTGFGFYLDSSGRAPELKITSPTDSTVYLKGGAAFSITGETTASEGIPTVEVFVGDAATPAWQHSFTETEGIDLGGKKKYSFTAAIPSSVFDQTTGKEYPITIKSRIGNKAATVLRTVRYDVHEPEIDFTSISPVIGAYEFASEADKASAASNIKTDGTFKLPCINGKVHFKGLVQDEFTKVTSVEWHVIQDNVTIASIGGTIETSFDFELDTTAAGIADNKNITVSFVASDSAGNTTTVNKQYFVCQNTDKPVAGPNNPNAWTTKVQQPKQIRNKEFGEAINKIAAGSAVYARVLDDDGIKSVKFKVEKLTYDSNYENCAVDSDQSSVPAEIKEETLTIASSPVETIVSHQMPSASGYYRVTITVKDLNDKESELPRFVVQMTGAPPDVAVTNKTDFIKTGGDIQLEVTMRGEAPFTVVVLQDNGTPTWAAGTPITVNSTELVNDAKTITVTPISSPHSRTIRVRVTDSSSGVTTKDVTYKVDNTVPNTPVIESPANDSVGNKSLKGTTFVFSGTANDAPASSGETSSGIKKLYYAFMTSDTNPSTWTEQSAVSGTWNINATLQTGMGAASGTTLREGEYWLYVKTEDGAGNESAVTKSHFMVDQSAPAITEVKLNDSHTLTAGSVKFFNTASGDFTVRGKVEDTHGLQSFTVDGATVAPGTGGTWSYTITRGVNTRKNFSVIAKDKAGRETKQDYSIFCDTEKPVLTITNPDTDLQGAASLATGNYTFRGAVQDAGSGVATFKYMITQTELSTDDAIITSAESGTGWETVAASSFSVPKELSDGTSAHTGKLHEGQWYLYLYATDNVGTKAVQKRVFAVDKDSPTLTLDTIASVTKQAVTVKGTASDTNGIRTVSVKITPKPAHWTTDTKTFTVASFAAGETFSVGTGNNLPDSTYTIEVTATDNAGKTSSQTKTVLVDTAPPSGTVSVLDAANYSPSGKNWYKKEAIKVKFVPTADSGSEVAEVKAKLRKAGTTDVSGTEELVKKTSGGSTWWEATLPNGVQGQNDIYLTVKDAAGNAVEFKETQTPYVSIDTEAPNGGDVYAYVADDTDYTTKTPLMGSSTTNGKTAKTFVVKVQDNDTHGADTYSGVKSVYFKYGNGASDKIEATVLNAANHTYKITIPANTVSTQYQKTGTVKFYLEDNVGNSSQSAPFSFVLDETAPTVEINPVLDVFSQSDGDTTSNIDVNGELKLSGNASDGYKVDKLSLKYFVGDTEPADWKSDTGIKTATVTGTTSWTASINTAQETDQKKLFIKAFAEDEAGNSGEASTMTLYINQDSDRPIITFSNLDLSQPQVWLIGIKKIYGSILDDDGITSFAYKNGSSGAYQPITITNGSWNQDMQDGSNELYFKIVDSKGKTFESAVSAAAVQPKLKSVKGNPPSATIKNGALSLKVDTTSPAYSNLEFAAQKTDGATSAYTGDTATLMLGGDYTKLLVKLKASDQNGVASVKAELNGTSYDATIEGSTMDRQTANKNDAALHLWTFPEITIPASLTGTVTVRLTITDQAGTAREDNINLTVDNTKPVLSFTSHNSGATVFATAAVTVRGSVDSTDLAEWNYALTNSQTAPALSAADFKPLINGSTSFTLVFDGASSTASETHDQKLFDKICTLESKNATQLQGDDAIRNLYLHIYGKDRAGNTSDVQTLHVKAIPNGDKPTVAFSYPTSNGASLGGILRITGISEIQQSEVDGVYIQIDPEPTLTWTASANGTHYLNGSVYTKYTGKRYKLVSGVYTEAADGEYVQTNSSSYSLASSALYELTNAAFTSSWNTHLTTAEGGTPRYTRQNVTYNGGSEQAIKTSGSVSSWNITLNSHSEFNNSKAIALKVFAVSKTNKKSDERVIWFKMDPDAPQIGSASPLELVQYASGSSGTIVARRNYEANMWIRGRWYLRGSVTDDSGIKQITYKHGSSTVDLVKITNASANVGTKTTDPAYSSYVEVGTAHGSNYDYTLNIPVGSDESNKFGVLTYEISATEGTAQNLVTKQTIVLNYDNKAPDFAATTADVLNKSTWTEKLTTELHSSGTEVKNRAGTYGFYGIVNEASDAAGNQSGFSRVALYFTRQRPDNKTYIIDPMRTGGAGGLENFMETSPAEFETYNAVSASGDGLYWLKGRSFTVSGNNILTAATSTALHASIRKGGLVKVNGAIYPIDAVDTANKKVTIKGTLQDGTVDAYFAVCQVVDNFTQENGTTKAYDAATPLAPSSNDDGDQMIEGIIESGTTCTWKAFIDSKLILDGDVKLHFVAFDKAGNAVEKEYGAIVKNNAPRLYGVKYGTDVNGNGTIEENEYIKTFNDKYSVLIDSTTYYGFNGDIETPVTEITATDRLTVKTELSVVPRVVGGNLGLGYTYTYKQNPAASATTTAFAEYSPAAGHATDLRTENLGITVDQKFFIQNINDGEQDITFNIWDKTDGTTAGNNSNAAKIVIPVKVAVQDAVAPKAVFKPFMWKSARDNSLYANSKENGHIELEADLPTAFTTSATGVMDRDPKISGIVTFEGTITDNVIVKEINIKIPHYNGGSDIKIAERNASGELTSANMLTLSGGMTYANYSFTGTSAKDWYFEKVKDEYASDGSNTVEFKFHFNTQKITGVAKADVGIELSAKDRGKASVPSGTVVYTPNASTPGTTQTTAAANTGYYKVDVVPYISGVKTGLSSKKKNNSSVYARTAKGHYPVNGGKPNNASSATMTAETITLEGFNLGANTTINASTLPSGAYTHTVNGVESLNNKNNNDSKGGYDQSVASGNKVGDYAIYSNYYNRLPNNDNNNNLTDDVIFDVWQFNNRAARPISGVIENPTMKINPSNGMLGFAFTNGPLYFSMPGNTSKYAGTSGGVNISSSSQDFSYVYWQGSYDFMTSVTLHYDSAGKTYATAAGGDINATSADKFSLMTDRWGVSGAATGGSYGGTNANRIEMIAQAGDYSQSNTDINFDKQRVKSPAIASSRRDAGSTNLYMAYFDNLNDEIRFKYGNLGDSSSSKTNFGNFKDSYRHGTVTNGGNENYGKYYNGHVQVIAHTHGGSTSLGNPGEYVSLGVVKNGASDVVVLVWYDSTDGVLRYTYNTTPTTVRSGLSKEGWSEAKTIFTNAGEYCQIATDAGGGIHIAAYDGTNGDLKYAHLSSYNSAYTEATDAVIVDSYAIVGQNISIDVKQSGTTYVPYISYYALSSAKPKLAYRTSTAVGNGAISEVYTGDWEVTIIPTPSKTPPDRISVGAVTSNATGASTIEQYYGKCYANGSYNAVLGYQIRDSSTSGFIETAQMK